MRTGGIRRAASSAFSVAPVTRPISSTFPAFATGPIRAEGQLYWGPVTLYAQGGYNTTLGQISSGFHDSMEAWFVRGTARVYVNPNFRLEGTVLYADGKVDFVPYHCSVYPGLRNLAVAREGRVQI